MFEIIFNSEDEVLAQYNTEYDAKIEDLNTILNFSSERKEAKDLGNLEEIFNNIEKGIAIYGFIENGEDFVLKYVNRYLKDIFKFKSDFTSDKLSQISYYNFRVLVFLGFGELL